MTNIHKDDIEFRDNRLNGYRLFTDYDNIQGGDHYRLTANKYQEPGRKCQYVVVQKVTDDSIVWVNRYSPIGQHEYPDWQLRLGCEYRKLRLYKKI